MKCTRHSYSALLLQNNFTKPSLKTFTKQNVLSGRLLFEARNQKKEAKEMAVIEALKHKDGGEKSQAAAQ